MSPFPHVPTLYAVAAVNAAVAAALLLTTRSALSELRCRSWLVAFLAMCVSFATTSLQGSAQGSVPTILANAMGGMALAAAWHGCCRVRGASVNVALLAGPIVVWVGMLQIPAIHDSPSLQPAIASLIGVLLLCGTSYDAWRSWRATRLASMRDLALLFGLFIPYFLIRSVAQAAEMEWLLQPMGSWPGLIAATAIPYLLLALAREQAVETRRQQKADAERRSRADVDLLLKGLPAVAFLREIRPDGSTRLLHRGGDVERTTGWPAETINRIEILTELAVNFSPAELEAAIARAMKGEMVPLSFQIRQPDNGMRWVQAHARVVEYRPDGSALAVGYLVDIQDLKNAEGRAAHSARLASLGEMAAGLAHELRQPLAIVSLAAENTLDDIEAGDLEAASGRLRRIISQNQRASDIIENLRRFALGPQLAGDTQPVALHDTVAAALSLLGSTLQRNGVRVELSIPSPSPAILSWPGALEQILVNLLANANDALASRPAGTRWVQITATDDPATQTVCLTVADSGGGVPPSLIPRLFQPFVTTKPPDRGIGMGLAISHGMVRALGGTIGVQNNGDGAMFTIVLPSAPALFTDGVDTVQNKGTQPTNADIPQPEFKTPPFGR